eukprot:1142786-Pelagomonas_calceolata.AAC.1
MHMCAVPEGPQPTETNLTPTPFLITAATPILALTAILIAAAVAAAAAIPSLSLLPSSSSDACSPLLGRAPLLVLARLIAPLPLVLAPSFAAFVAEPVVWDCCTRASSCSCVRLPMPASVTRACWSRPVWLRSCGTPSFHQHPVRVFAKLELAEEEEEEEGVAAGAAAHRSLLQLITILMTQFVLLDSLDVQNWPGSFQEGALGEGAFHS